MEVRRTLFLSSGQLITGSPLVWVRREEGKEEEMVQQGERGILRKREYSSITKHKNETFFLLVLKEKTERLWQKKNHGVMEREEKGKGKGHPCGLSCPKERKRKHHFCRERVWGSHIG